MTNIRAYVTSLDSLSALLLARVEQGTRQMIGLTLSQIVNLNFLDLEPRYLLGSVHAFHVLPMFCVSKLWVLSAVCLGYILRVCICVLILFHEISAGGDVVFLVP